MAYLVQTRSLILAKSHIDLDTFKYTGALRETSFQDPFLQILGAWSIYKKCKKFSIYYT